MALFQKSVLKQQLAKLDDNSIQGSWKIYQSYFLDSKKQKEIIEKKEVQFQTLFLQKLFDNCLGYTIDSKD
jgi:hypothetical protein